jgi:hypothetical protein
VDAVKLTLADAEKYLGAPKPKRKTAKKK